MSAFFFRLGGGGFEAGIRDTVLIKHSIEKPFLRAGFGEGKFEMFRGNFRISEHEVRMTALTSFRVLSISDDKVEIAFDGENIPPIVAAFSIEAGRLAVGFSMAPVAEGRSPNRFAISLPSSANDHVYGCGEQFSRFDLKGWNFPLWTSEQGVGRNKDTEITRLADRDGGGGGDYYWTFFPQTSFISSSGRWYSLDTTAYSEFDFRAQESHELYSWDLPRKLVAGAAPTMRDLVFDLSSYYGRQGSLPSWCHEGVILGIQGGTSVCLKKLAAAKTANVKVAGIWAQDWQGVNMTSFGQRLRWNWEWDSIRYPKLQEEIARLKREGIRFLGYINPYVGAGMSLFLEAASRVSSRRTRTVPTISSTSANSSRESSISPIRPPSTGTRASSNET